MSLPKYEVIFCRPRKRRKKGQRKSFKKTIKRKGKKMPRILKPLEEQVIKLYKLKIGKPDGKFIDKIYMTPQQMRKWRDYYLGKGYSVFPI